MLWTFPSRSGPAIAKIQQKRFSHESTNKSRYNCTFVVQIFELYNYHCVSPSYHAIELDRNTLTSFFPTSGIILSVQFNGVIIINAMQGGPRLLAIHPPHPMTSSSFRVCVYKAFSSTADSK